MNESFVVKDASGKQVAVKYSESEAKKHADELSKKTGKKHTASFNREANVKRPVKEETEQLDEGHLVKNGSKYLKGHPAGGEQMSWVADKSKATVFKSKGEISRHANMRGWQLVPHKPMKEETEQLDEISQKTASQYMKGAMRDTIGGKKDRNKGISRAMSRLSGTNKPLMNAPVKEEAEVLNVAQTYKKIANKHLKDSTSKTTTAAQKAYAKKMLTRALEASKMDNHKDALNHYRGTSLREAAKWRRDDLEGKTWRAANWDDGGLSGPKGKLPESVEHLDELNRSTVSSYKEKASNEVKQMKPYAKGEYSGIVKRVIDRRKRGIAVASKRLGEEKTSSEEPTSPSLAARTLERSIKKSKDPAKSQNTKSSDDKFQSEPDLSSQIMKEHK